MVNKLIGIKTICDRIAQMVLNILLYLHNLQMKFVNIYKGLVRQLYIYIDVVYILSIGYLSISLISPYQLMLMQVKETFLKINPDYD